MADEVIPLFVASLRERGLAVPVDKSDVTVNMEDASEAFLCKLRMSEQEATLPHAIFRSRYTGIGAVTEG